MKHKSTINNSKLILTASAIIIVGCAAIAAFATSRQAYDQHSHGAAGHASIAEVHIPQVPEVINFCGHDVDLDRVDMYERFDRELTSLTYTHGTTSLIIKRANRYFPQMMPILRANGVPTDIIYLACVESSLDPRAYSPAKAAGMWQFIESTAKQYGLEVSDEVDERYNIDKATAAACRYLKNAYREYGDWASVMASYNAGRTRITNSLANQGVESAFDIYLNQETMRYPFRIMAMKAVLENASDYGFRIKASDLYQPRECDLVEVKGSVNSWADWARDHGISYAELRDENPWIRAPKLTNRNGRTYTVRVPRRESLKRSTQLRHTFDERWISR